MTDWGLYSLCITSDLMGVDVIKSDTARLDNLFHLGNHKSLYI